MKKSNKLNSTDFVPFSFEEDVAHALTRNHCVWFDVEAQQPIISSRQAFSILCNSNRCGARMYGGDDCPSGILTLVFA
jgi:hypothetical protein